MSVGWPLSERWISQLFPFFVRLDDDMLVRGIGPSLAKMLPDLRIGDDLREWFELQTPMTEFSAPGLRQAAEQLIVLRGLMHDVVMRGQVMPASQDPSLLLLCTPWLTEPRDLGKLGLLATDFALHDPIMDMLHVVQAQRAGSDDLREIATLLEDRERELRAAHSELKIQYRDLVELASSRQRFLANMSHEMRTPLNGVIGSVDLMLAQLDEAGDRDDGLRRIRESALTLLSTVDGLLEVAGGDVAPLRRESVRWDAPRLIDGVVDEHRVNAAERGVAFEIRIDDDVPNPMAGDPLRVSRIINNLVENAAKFSAPGIVAVELSVRHEGGKGVIRIVVSSLGDPISSDAQQRLFEPFFQADTRRNRSYSGSGLGLTMARKLATELGGDVSYARANDRNEFVFDFPALTGTQYIHDPLRLAAVDESGLVDSPIEDRYDHITRLAARVTGAPIALISLVQAEQQFFKSHIGLGEPWAGLRATPLSHSFCKHVVSSRAPLSVPDVRADPLVRDNLAVSEIGVAAYLGVPIEFNNEVIGSLCVISDEPRTWSSADLDALNDLVRLLVDTIHLGDETTRKDAAVGSKSSSLQVGQALNILLVEDDEINQIVLSKMLARLGHQYAVASSGHAALECTQHDSYDIVLMDLHMPGLDGIETIRAMQGQLGDRIPPVVAVTADVMPGTFDECVAAGFVEVLTKPLRLASVAECLGRCVAATADLDS